MIFFLSKAMAIIRETGLWKMDCCSLQTRMEAMTICGLAGKYAKDTVRVRGDMLLRSGLHLDFSYTITPHRRIPDSSQKVDNCLLF